jgi:translation initiation factor IF-2
LSMTEEKTMRLNQAAKTLNIGISSVVEFLTLKGFEIENKPTAKITQEQFKLLLKAFESSVADKLEALEKKKTPELEPKKKEPEPEVSKPVAAKPVTPPAAPAPAPVAPKPVETPAPVAAAPETPKSAPTPAQDQAQPEETPATGVKLQGIKVVGKIDLNAKGKPAPAPAKPAEAPAPAASPKAETPAPVAAAPAPQPEAAPKPEPEKPAAPVAPAKPEPAAAPAPQPQAPVAAAPKPASAPQPAPAPKPAAPVAPAASGPKPPVTPPTPETPAADAPIETISGKGDQLKGLTVLGKIELPKDSFRKKGGKPVASSDNKNRPAGAPGAGGQQGQGDKKKRKRIITQAPTTGATDNRGPGGPGQQRPGGGGGRDFGNRPGGGDRNRPGQGNQRPITPAAPKPEVTDKQIQEQIKATLARLSGGKGGNQGNRSKYRREKRSAIADADEQRRAQEQSESKTLKLTEFISANDLASLMNVSVNEVIKVCLGLGMFVSINQRLDAEAITIITDEFGYDVEFLSAEEEESLLEQEEDAANLQDRAPIVTIMGHVDHGKTSLLDYIRNSRVASGEAGGITQHIGAYDVLTETGKRITFLDTPGHEAFTAMRARGAKITDVVIIVVAADDDVMPQTKEALNHAQAAGVPIVIAINKIDKAGANPDRIREQLAGINVLVEEWGGKYQCQEISAKQGTNVSDLLEKVLLEAEILELKANPERNAIGTVIEASLDKGRGYVTTVLVQTGTLKIGDVILAGSHYGRVKAMTDHRGKKMKQAIPSTPVQVLGLDGAPQAGDKFQVMETEREAREIASNRTQLQREQSMRTKKHITLDEIGRRLAIGSFKELNVIVKGDVDGSVEALSDSLLKLSTAEVQVNILSKGVGQISESDVLLASASDAIIIGFQVRPSQNARKLAEQEQIDIRLYSIIYNAINELKDAMEGMLAPTVQEVVTANVEVREVFKITKVGTIAGCMVTDGTITRNSKVRIVRDGIVVHSGDILALKRFKDDVAEVRTGFECGISIRKFDDLHVGDIIEGYEEKEIKRTL